MVGAGSFIRGQVYLGARNPSDPSERSPSACCRGPCTLAWEPSGLWSVAGQPALAPWVANSHSLWGSWGWDWDTPAAPDLCSHSSEPEPIVSLTFVKNDSYEKGNDLVVVHVYVKEIHKESSKVLFREQDFTLVFQTRYRWQGGGWQAPGLGLPHVPDRGPQPLL